MPPAPRPLEDRFWPKVEKTDGCWLWTGSIDAYGYGQINSGGKRGRPLKAHRVSYALLVGPVADNRCVLHRCDNRRCVRPDHLWVGTRPENSRDMVAKGRGTAGRTVPHGGTHWTRAQPGRASEIIRKAWVTRKARLAQRPRFCKRGHLLTPETTYLHRHGTASPTWDCRECDRLRHER